jgi:hypothetical protein
VALAERTRSESGIDRSPAYQVAGLDTIAQRARAAVGAEAVARLDAEVAARPLGEALRTLAVTC